MEKILVLKYRLNKRSVSVKFFHLIRNIQTKASRHGLRNTIWDVHPAGEEILLRLYLNLLERIDFFNKNNRYGLFFDTLPPTVDALTVSIIETVIDEFHKLSSTSCTHGESMRMSSKRQQTFPNRKNYVGLHASTELDLPLKVAIKNICHLALILEHILSHPTTQSNNSYFATTLFSDPPVVGIPLSSSELEFDYIHSLSSELDFGDLLLCIGHSHSPPHSFITDRGVAVNKVSGQSAAQGYITPNLLAWFGSTINGSEKVPGLTPLLVSNCVAENLVTGAWKESASHMRGGGHGRRWGIIRLGRLVKPQKWLNKSNDEIVHELSTFDQVFGYRLSFD